MPDLLPSQLHEENIMTLEIDVSKRLKSKINEQTAKEYLTKKSLGEPGNLSFSSEVLCQMSTGPSHV